MFTISFNICLVKECKQINNFKIFSALEAVINCSINETIRFHNLHYILRESLSVNLNVNIIVK